MPPFEAGSSHELSRSLESYDVSVVVPTYNREQLLPRTLESLVHQRSDSVRYEVLVVDNNSSDGTRAVVETFARRWPAIRYLFEAPPSRRVSRP